MKLAVHELCLSRGDLVLAEGLSFAVEAGEAIAVTGANGSGKSTLLRAILGLVAPDSGSIRLTVEGEDAPIAQNAHYLGHGNAMKAELSVRENLRFWARLLPEDGPGDADALIDEAAGPLDLDRLLDLPFHYLSAGQRRRVALARLWVAPRPLWLLDEPTAALDAASDLVAREMIEAHRAEGGMVVAATHLDLGMADARTLEMDHRPENKP